TPTGEIWYAAHPPPGGTDIRAITPAGSDRLVATLPGDYLLYDIAADGRVLLGHNVESAEIFGSLPGEAREQNLSHLDFSEAVGLSASGDTLLFNEGGRVGSVAGTYVRRTDGSPPKRLRDDCKSYAVSP